MPIPVTDRISTTAASDTYATHETNLGRGGLHTVDTYNDMLAITPERREGGMMCHVRENNKLYKLSPTGQNFKVITNELNLFTDVASLPTSAIDPSVKVGMYAFADAEKEVYQLEEDLTTWSKIDSSIPSHFIFEVTDVAALDLIPVSDRYLNMIVKDLATGDFYKLQTIAYDANNKFTTSVADWVKLNYSLDVTEAMSLSDVPAIPSTDTWAGKKVAVTGNLELIEFTRPFNEWEEVPFDQTPYYIVNELEDLQTVPAYYWQPGLLVFVRSEMKIYTRNTDNNGWEILTADGTGEPGADGADGVDGVDGVGIQTATINGLGELELLYTDGTIQNVGFVLGPKGIDGVSIVNIQLFEDPEVPGNVYFTSELSDGRVIRTRDPISGYNGLSVADAFVSNNNELIIIRSDGSQLSPIPISNLTPVSVSDMYITDGDLIVEYTDGTLDNLGDSGALEGRGIDDFVIQSNGDVQIQYSDDPAYVTLGNFKSIEQFYVYEGNVCVVLNTTGNVNGTGTEGDVVVVKNSSGQSIGEVTVPASGTWSFRDATVIGFMKSLVEIYRYASNICVVYSDTPMLTITGNDGDKVIVSNSSGDLIGEVTIPPSGSIEFPDAEVVGNLRNIERVYKYNGNLYATYDDSTRLRGTRTTTTTDSSGNTTIIPLANSTIDVYNSDGDLIGQTTTDSNGNWEFTDSELIGESLSVVSGTMRDRELIFITDKIDNTTDSGFVEVNVGEVDNLRGRSVESVNLEDNNLLFTLEGGIVMPPIPVTGLTPISINNISVNNEGNIIVNTTDGTEYEVGPVENLNINDIKTITIVNHELLVTYSDNSVVNVGDIPTIDGVFFEDGMLKYTLTNDPTNKIDVDIIKSVEKAEIDDGKLVFYFADDITTPVVIGDVPGISAARINADNELEVDYTDGTTNQILGNVLGPRGFSITNANVDGGGDLILFTDDPSNPTFNAGLVRPPNSNLLGDTYSYTAVDGDDTFAATHDGKDVLVFVNGVLLEEEEYDLADTSNVRLLTPVNEGDRVRIVVYTEYLLATQGRGVNTVTESNGVYKITLEDTTQFDIDLGNIDPAVLDAVAPGIADINVLPNGDIEVELTNGSTFIAGSSNNAISIIGAVIATSDDPANGVSTGDLLILTDDLPPNDVYNAGSVLSGTEIVGARIDTATGDMILELRNGSEINAGPAANYVENAKIENDTGDLILTMSLGNTINAGTVRNPLLGGVIDYVCFAGQTDFLLEHKGFDVVVYANGIALSKTSLDLSDPSKVVLLTPRDSGDIVKIIFLYRQDVVANELAGSSSASDNTYYGKDISGNLGFHPISNIKNASPVDIVATPGQTVFNVNHNGVVEVIVDGNYVMPSQYSTPNSNRVEFLSPMSGGEEVRIVVLTTPSVTEGLNQDNYSRFKFLTNQRGGTALSGAWRPRLVNTMTDNSIAGSALDRNNIVLPAGVYYIRGWASANAVGANAIKLYNLTTRRDLLIGDSVFSGVFGGSGDSRTNVFNASQMPNTLAPIEGYIRLDIQSQIQVQHRVLLSRNNTGFGAVGGGLYTAVGGTSLNPPFDGSESQNGLAMNATLVDIQVWRVGF